MSLSFICDLNEGDLQNLYPLPSHFFFLTNRAYKYLYLYCCVNGKNLLNSSGFCGKTVCQCSIYECQLRGQDNLGLPPSPCISHYETYNQNVFNDLFTETFVLVQNFYTIELKNVVTYSMTYYDLRFTQPSIGRDKISLMTWKKNKQPPQQQTVIRLNNPIHPRKGYCQR